MAKLKTIKPDNTYLIPPRPDNITYVQVAADLPAVLTTGIYRLKSSISVASFVLQAGAQVWIESDGKNKVLTLTGTGDLIGDGTSTPGLLVMEGFDVAITGTNATLFNLNGVLFNSREVNFLFTATENQTIGTLINSPLSVSFIDSIFNAFASGISVDNSATRTVADHCNFTSDKTGTGNIITVGANCPRSELTNLTIDCANAEAMFDINSAFVGQVLVQNYTKVNASSTTYAAGGLDNKSIYVKNDESKKIGSFVVTDNVEETVIGTINVWVDLNLDAAVAGSNMERFSLTNATTGELKVLALDGFVGTGFASISAVSAGGSQIFEFRIVKDGAPMADGVKAPRSVGSLVGALPLIVPAAGDTAALFKIQVRNIDGTSNITVTDMVLVLQ
jgi:hypothetical protein